MMPAVLRTVTATRYVTPLREGGSLPAIVEADDDGLYVVKFRGAGQGPKALAAEIVAGELARALGLPVPELVLVELDAGAGARRARPGDPGPDPRQRGPEPRRRLPARLAAVHARRSRPSPSWRPPSCGSTRWCENVDRTPRNPNLLRWHGNLWLIDHGAALYVHHGTGDPLAVARRPFPAIRDHVLLPSAGLDRGRRRAARAARRARRRRPRWSRRRGPTARRTPSTSRARLEAPRDWVEEAERARA